MLENQESAPKDENEEALEKYLLAHIGDHKPPRLKIMHDIFRVCLKLAKESPGTLNLKITSTVLKELRFSFKMFYPHRFSRKITMFGSARVPAETPLYQLAKGFAEEAVKRNFHVITGGGPGIMAAGNEGAQVKGFGLNIKLPVEQSANPFIDQDNKLIHYKYFFTRKLFLVKEATAFAFFPGGFGTFDEAFEVLTLLQTGKSTMFPVVMVEPVGFGYWTELVKFMDNVLTQKGFIAGSDKNLYRIFNSPEAALDHIEHFYKNYHSMRFVKEMLVLRLKTKLSDAILKKMNESFAVLTNQKPMVQCGPLPEEANEPELKDLTRLVIPFEKQDYGLLRGLIDFINDNTV